MKLFWNLITTILMHFGWCNGYSRHRCSIHTSVPWWCVQQRRNSVLLIIVESEPRYFCRLPWKICWAALTFAWGARDRVINCEKSSLFVAKGNWDCSCMSIAEDLRSLQLSPTLSLDLLFSCRLRCFLFLISLSRTIRPPDPKFMRSIVRLSHLRLFRLIQNASCVHPLCAPCQDAGGCAVAEWPPGFQCQLVDVPELIWSGWLTDWLADCIVSVANVLSPARLSRAVVVTRRVRSVLLRRKAVPSSRAAPGCMMALYLHGVCALPLPSWEAKLQDGGGVQHSGSTTSDARLVPWQIRCKGKAMFDLTGKRGIELQ